MNAKIQNIGLHFVCLLMVYTVLGEEFHHGHEHEGEEDCEFNHNGICSRPCGAGYHRFLHDDYNNLCEPGMHCCVPNTPGDAVCDVWGDPNYLTFDDQMLHYLGHSCEYVMLQAGPLTVTAFNRERVFDQKHLSSLKWIQIIYRTRRGRSVTIRLENGEKITLNGKPYTWDKSRTQWIGAGLRLEAEGPFAEIRAYKLFEIKYNFKSDAQIYTHGKHWPDWTGICGNYDHIQSNDMRTKEGVQQPRNPAGWKAIGDSYVVDPDCVAMQGKP